MAVVVAVVHLVLAAVRRAWPDEALMLAIGRYHLDFGAVDQPPLTPLLARIADTVAPGSQIVLAVPAVLATAAAVVLTALTARELGGDERSQTLAALGQGTGIAAAQFGHWLTPYTLEPALWTAVFWLLLRGIRRDDGRALVAAGAVLGVAAQTRLFALLLGAVLLGAVAVLGPRKLLRRPPLWAGAVLALLIAAPTLLWQATHGWPQLAMTPVVAEENDEIYGSVLVSAAHGLAVTGPLLLGLAVCGLVALVRDPRLRDVRFVGAACVLLYLAMVLSGGRHYYPLALYPVLAAIGAVGLQHRREAGRPRRRAWPVVVVSGLLACVGALSSVYLAEPQFEEMLVSATADAYRALPAEQRDRTVLAADPYVYGAYLDAAPPGLGLPPAFGPNRAYGWFPEPPEDRDAMLLVGEPDRVRPWFGSARLVGGTYADTPLGTYGGLVGEVPTIWLLEDRKAPWPEIRDATRDLQLPPVPLRS
ncbi:glycosyltransferase family 39 protein [Pseudonocardia phyllosphaerae]|uniref:glycosyltransferase family 39 protein n=1 Tax=Pseudonocardia phyllosphaerae TaxID=3390502 RepID=UPI003978DEDF